MGRGGQRGAQPRQSSLRTGHRRGGAAGAAGAALAGAPLAGVAPSAEPSGAAAGLAWMALLGFQSLFFCDSTVFYVINLSKSEVGLCNKLGINFASCGVSVNNLD